MSMIRPRTLTPRGIVSTLLPLHFQKLRHPQQLARGDNRNVQVPLDADADMLRVDFKRKVFAKKVTSFYNNNHWAPGGYWVNRGDQPKNAAWCVVTRGWAPRSILEPGHIWPSVLGTNLLRHVTSVPGLYEAHIGLLLPKPTLEALTDLALVIVPDRERGISAPDEASAPGDRSVYNYRFRVMDEHHPAMSTTLFRNAPKNFDLPQICTRHLDGRLLVFAGRKRPAHSVIYFQACCAVWKATYLEDPKCDNEADFVARYQTNIKKIWGLHRFAKGADVLRRQLSFIDDIFLNKCRDSQSTLASEHVKAEPDWEEFVRARKDIKTHSHGPPVEQDDLSWAGGAATPTRTSRDKEGPLLLQNQDDLPRAGGHAKPAKKGRGKDGSSMMSHEHTEQPKKNWKKADRARLARTSRLPSARESWRETGQWQKEV